MPEDSADACAAEAVASIDRLNESMGKLIMWLVLAAVLISAGNAIVRKAFNIGSNAYLEIQWYLFAAVFMLGAGYVLLKNAHVRIDFISGKLSKRTNAIIDAVGIVLVILMPLCVIMIDLSLARLHARLVSGEMSPERRRPDPLAGAGCSCPLGFALLLLQALSELIKRVAFLRGPPPDPSEVDEKSRGRASCRGAAGRGARPKATPPQRSGEPEVMAFIAQNFVPLMFAACCSCSC
jgi:TRAP-type mannitol/chloroaromatic compound transport system permease small subunit